MPAGKLNAKQERFVHEYLVDLNATQAAIRTGYSQKTARQIGARLLSHVDVQALIQSEQAKRLSKMELTGERVLAELARLAFVDIRKAFNEDGTLKKPHDIDDDTAAALAGIDTTATVVQGSSEDDPPLSLVTKKVKTFDKKGALELALRHLGLLNDKLDLNAKVSGQVVYKANMPPRG